MASQDKQEEVPQQSQEAAEIPQSVGWIDSIKRRYELTKEDINTYPYVWASYGVVYGGLSAWLIYRFRKLRQLEDRVRIKQERMRQRVRQEEAAKAAAKSTSGSNSTAKPVANIHQPIQQVENPNPTKLAEKIHANKVPTDPN